MTDAARLFVAAWPPDRLLDALVAIDLPTDVRPTPRSRLHVTLRFLGAVDAGAVPALIDALGAALATVGPARATLGTATEILGGGRVLVVPVDGLDPVASAVEGAVVATGLPPEGRAFRGHVTLARAGRGRADLRRLAGTAVPAPDGAPAWPLAEVILVRSALGGGAPRYEPVARFGIGTGA